MIEKFNKKEIDKILIDMNLSKKLFAKELNVSRVYLTNVINGKKPSKKLKNRILEYIKNIALRYI